MDQNKNSVIAVAILAAFLPPFTASSVTVALPSIGREFAMPAVALSWLITSYLLSVAVFLIPFGKVGDMYGRRNVFLVGIILFTGASFLSALVPSVAILYLFRVLQGIGGAMIFGTGTAMLTAVAEPGERGRLLGLSISSTYLGLSLGPTLGGLLIEQFGWKSVFYANVPVGLIIILLVAAKIGSDRPSQTPKSAFDLSPFRQNPVFLFSNLAALFNYSAAMGAGFLMSLYLQYVKGFSPKHAGLIMITQPLLMALFSPLAGRLSDKIEPRIVASAGMTLTALGLFLFCFISATTPLPFILAGFAMLGTGISFFSSPNTSAVMSSVEKQHLGMASSIAGTMRLIGQVLSIGIAALIMSLFLGSATITPLHFNAFIMSARWSYLVFGLLCIFGVAASLARGRIKR